MSKASTHYSSYFGLTTEETAALLAYYGLDLNDDVKSYYDGYCFSGLEIYHLWSILSYAHAKKTCQLVYEMITV